MVNRQGPSAGPVWYEERDVQVALLWNQVNAVCFQLAQTNQQLCLQQNLILSLQKQREADQNLISKLLAKLFEEKMPVAEPCAAEEESDEEGCDADDWIMVHAPSEETMATEGAPPLPAEHLHYAGLPNTEESLCNNRCFHHEPECCKCCKAKMSAAAEPCAEGTAKSQKSSDTESTGSPGGPMEDPVVPSPAALWLGPICHQRSDRSCEVFYIASDSDSEIGDEEVRWDESPASEFAREQGRQLCCHSSTALTGIEVSAGECTPSDLHVANLLPYLGVHELLNLRLVSRRNRSPEALTAHVAEMGSMETADAVKDFARKLELFVVNPFLSNDSAFEGDAEQQKLFDCRAWCMALASKTFSHFAESCSRPTVERTCSVCCGTAGVRIRPLLLLPTS